MAQRSIFSFLSPGQKRSVSNLENPQTPKKQKLDLDQKDKSPKVNRKFNEEWKIEFSWVKCAEKNEHIVMICDGCRDAGKTNSFARDGSTNLQKSALSRHERNPEHLLALEGKRAKAKHQTFSEVIEHQINRSQRV